MILGPGEPGSLVGGWLAWVGKREQRFQCAGGGASKGQDQKSWGRPLGWTVCLRLSGPGEATGKKEPDAGQDSDARTRGGDPVPGVRIPGGGHARRPRQDRRLGLVREGSQVRGPALSWVLLGDLPQHLG